ncbi:hypothetical protein [Aeromicrobium sp.]|uniref:hypothetical protein n=1 Tax=Aeromicrobium sp. TaxID=1871063 RepID=UPI0030C3A428
MSRQLLTAGVALVALLSVTACSGSDDEPQPKPTKSTSATPAAPEQPEGADGVTYRIQNWDDYAEDPAILAWKQANEALAASINQGKVLPSLRRASSKSVLRENVTAVNNAKKNDWRVKKLGKVRVETADTVGSKATLLVCLWAPSVGLYEKDGSYYGDKEVFWFRQDSTLKKTSGGWVVATSKYDGKCPGGAPE